jgi:hypothetical protein
MRDIHLGTLPSQEKEESLSGLFMSLPPGERRSAPFFRSDLGTQDRDGCSEIFFGLPLLQCHGQHLGCVLGNSGIWAFDEVDDLCLNVSSPEYGSQTNYIRNSFAFREG